MEKEWNKPLETEWSSGEEMYVCPRCGKLVPMDMNFCGYCGIYLNKNDREETHRL